MNRSIYQLVLAQAIMMSVNSLMVTSAAIIGSHLSSNPALATLPLALQFVAVMCTTIPASLLMRAVGRRSGFLLASLIGLAGASCGALAIYLDSFLLFCIGALGTGMYTGFGHYFRFAAIEVAPRCRKQARQQRGTHGLEVFGDRIGERPETAVPFREMLSFGGRQERPRNRFVEPACGSGAADATFLHLGRRGGGLRHAIGARQRG